MLSRAERIARGRETTEEIKRFLADGRFQSLTLVLYVVALRRGLIADDVAPTLSTLQARGVVTIDFVHNLVRLTTTRSR